MYNDRERWPSEETPFEVTQLDLSFSPGPHPLFLRHQAEIEANWDEEKTTRPYLFNGQLILQSALSLSDGAVIGIGHAVPYSMLLWWRKRLDQNGAFHVFGFSVLVSSDNAIIAIRMGNKTATPGEVYCPAGLIDLADITNGKLDIRGNMRREVLEETGLDITHAVEGEKLFASYMGCRVVVFRFYHLPAPAQEILSRINTYVSNQEQPEIEAALEIRSSDRDAYRYNPSMYPILDMFFGASERKHALERRSAL